MSQWAPARRAPRRLVAHAQGRASRRAAGARRGEQLAGHLPERHGSGASDGVAEVTFDENTSEHVVGTHDVVHGTSARGHDSRRVHIRASRKSSEDAEAAGGEGDGGSAVGDPETSAEADTVEADTGEIDVATGAARAGVGVANTRSRYDSRPSETVHRETNRHDARQQTPSASAAKRDGRVGETRRADSGRRLPRTFSGADHGERRGSAARSRAAPRRPRRCPAPRELFCPLIARPPPAAAAGIPGTAGGEGRRRAPPRGTPCLHARGAGGSAGSGGVHGFEPVCCCARSRPRTDSSHSGVTSVAQSTAVAPSCARSPSSTAPPPSPRSRRSCAPVAGAEQAARRAGDERRLRGKERGDDGAARRESRPHAAETSPRKGVARTLRVTRHSELTAKALRDRDAEEGEGEASRARATRARRAARARARRREEALPKSSSGEEKTRRDGRGAFSFEGG